MSNLGNLHAQLGDLDAAEAAQREAIAISHRLNTPDDGAVAMANLGMLLVNRGQVQAGRDALTRALDVMNEGAWPHAATLAALADLDRRQGHLKLARRRMSKAEAHLREFGFRPPLARVLCLRGLLDLEEGDAVAARAALDGARELIEAAHIERTSEIHRHVERLAEALA
jgi:tetratricopeptide (TPR) repeat protein